MLTEREVEWRKVKYKRFVADIDKEEADVFLEVLKSDNKAFQFWFKEQMKSYVDQNKQI